MRVLYEVLNVFKKKSPTTFLIKVLRFIKIENVLLQYSRVGLLIFHFDLYSTLYLL